MKNPLQSYNWHLEISSKCALSCFRCSRVEENGRFPVTQLGLAFIQKLFTPETLRSHVWRITFSGGLGDPIYNTEFLEIVSYLKSHRPEAQLVVVTNGSYREKEWWNTLSSLLNGNDEVIFSIDGWDHESNNLYRRNSDWNSIMTGLKVMSHSAATVRRSTIVFRFNELQLDRIRALAEEHGADQFHVVISERFGPNYADPSTGLDPLEPVALKRENSRTLRFKTRFSKGEAKARARKPFNDQIKALKEEYYGKVVEEFGGATIFPTCKYGYRGLYVDVEGYLYPCSWVAHPYGEKRSRYITGKSQTYADGFARFKPRVDLKRRSLAEIMADPFWEEWTRAWHSAESADIICENKCYNRPVLRSTAETTSLEELGL